VIAMNIPFPILKSAGGNKGAAVLAVLAGLFIIAAMRQQQRASASTAPR
jgi:hypothetical protein